VATSRARGGEFLASAVRAIMNRLKKCEENVYAKKELRAGALGFQQTLESRRTRSARTATRLAGMSSPTHGINGAGQRRIETQTRQTRQQTGHDGPAHGAVRPFAARARRIRTVVILTGIVFRTVIENGTNAAHAGQRVNDGPRPT
jgi:hypothetical protein